MGPRRAALAAAAALALVVALPGCASTPPNGAEAAPDGAEARPVTTLLVENRGFQDMTIFVVRDSYRQRIGMATGNRTTQLTIPANLIFGVTSLRFLADPIGGTRAPVSHEIQVRAGEEIRLTIMP